MTRNGIRQAKTHRMNPRLARHVSDGATSPEGSGYGGLAEYWELVTRAHGDPALEISFLEHLLRRHASNSVHSILDVGCGSGVHCSLLAERGYDVVGIDCENEMIEYASRRKASAKYRPQYIVSDMTNFCLDRTFDAAFSWRATVDHLLTDEDFMRMLENVKRHIPDGLFVFEFWQSRGVRPSASFWERHQVDGGRSVFFLQSTKFDRATYIVNRTMELLDVDIAKGRLKKHHVTMTQAKLRTIPEIRALVDASGYETIGFYDATQPEGGLLTQDSDAHQVLCVCTSRR